MPRDRCISESRFLQRQEGGRLAPDVQSRHSPGGGGGLPGGGGGGGATSDDPRPPLTLTPVIVTYNFALVLLSAYMCYEIFFIARKKTRQITFLYVYHHATMIINWWLGVAYVAGGQAFFHPLLNSGVHVVMYTYYALLALGPQWRPYLWWKRYLTTLQLGQFAIVIVHTITNIVVDCSFPKGFNWAMTLYALSLIALFANFYRHAYSKSPSQRARKLPREQKGVYKNGHGHLPDTENHVD
ncbi:hypothetical protein ACOMHN_019568 [Nucella lapillus]